MFSSSALMVLSSGSRGEEGAGPAPDTPAARAAVDLDLAERVQRALGATGYPPLRAIEIAVCSPLTVLRGRVPTYHLKQVAQAAAMAVAGIGAVRNDVEVVRS
jgi:hypothetical protein